MQEGKVLELIAAVAEQATERDFQIRDELRSEFKMTINSSINSLREELYSVRDELRAEMRDLRNDNATFHDEIIGYLKRAEQEREFMSLHLKRHDEQIAELERRR